MAKERYSNEVIAQVLTQVVKNLQTDMDIQRKAMDEHIKRLEEMLSKPIEPPKLNLQPMQELGKAMREEREALTADRKENLKLLKEVETTFQENTSKSIERLKKSDSFSWWSWRILWSGTILIVSGVVFFFISFKMNQAKIIEEQKKEIENYEKFLDEAQNARNVYDSWIKKQPKK